MTKSRVMIHRDNIELKTIIDRAIDKLHKYFIWDSHDIDFMTHITGEKMCVGIYFDGKIIIEESEELPDTFDGEEIERRLIENVMVELIYRQITKDAKYDK